MIGGGVGQCRGYPANMPAHDDDDDDDDYFSPSCGQAEGDCTSIATTS